jgi:hypothetical protein
MVISNFAFISLGVIPNVTISNRHIRVHCIDFELDDDKLPPLIYVEDLSTNGTFLSSRYDQKGEYSRRLLLNQPFLVNNGDQIRLGDQTTCVFECFMKETPRSMTELQVLETKVSPLELLMVTTVKDYSISLQTILLQNGALGLEATLTSFWLFITKLHDKWLVKS